MKIYAWWCAAVAGSVWLLCSAMTGKERMAGTETLHVGSVVHMPPREKKDMAAYFKVYPIPDSIFRLMQGRSYPAGCKVARNVLRYVRLLHYDRAGKVRVGELVCHEKIAPKVLRIFEALYLREYPMTSVLLIDRFEADDERSMQANNTSCFCYRVVRGSKRLSKHSEGLAIDINPLYNPCVRSVGGKRVVQPHTAGTYVDRNGDFPCKITQTDPAYRLFTEAGFRWGGAWRTVKDYQHFEY